MRRMISIVDLSTGRIWTRPSTTLTLDLPGDFDREIPIAALDAKSHARYHTTDGKTVSRVVHPRPLSWRVRGEECLIAEQAAGVTSPGQYTLCAVEPLVD